ACGLLSSARLYLRGSTMNKVRALIFTATLAAAAALQIHDAAACGGGPGVPSGDTQVNSPPGSPSLSHSQTTLYDQITYSGDPSEFAWVLPVKGVATVGLSSDALFQTLDQNTQVTIYSPQVYCDPGGCPYPAADFAGGGAGGGSGTSGGG